MAYAINWLTEHQKKHKFRSRTVINSDTEEEDQDEVRELEPLHHDKKKQPKRRICISEEAFGEFNDRTELQLH